MNQLTSNQIIDLLNENDFDAFVVGGAVRDILLGSEPKDIDIVTNARPDDIENIFAAIAKVNLVGKTFGVVIVDGTEVATFRFDVHDGIGDVNCEVVYADNIHDDLARRDFTINAMAQCATSGDIVDNHDGRRDLENRVIRFVGDADRRIQEDPNRIIRAARFAAKIDGDFDIHTLRALRRNAHLVKTHVAPERIRMEILKAMDAPFASTFFAALEIIGVLEDILPELHRAVNHDHGNHHVESVFEHMMSAGDHACKRDAVLRLAIYLHDYGKPQAFVENVDDPNNNFVFHEVIGAKLVERDLRSLKFSNEEVKRVVNVVRNHMYNLRDVSDKAFRRLLKKFADADMDWRDFVRVRLADRFANFAHDPFTLSQWREWVTRFTSPQATETPFSTHDLAVTGRELIEELNLTPGPVVGQLQRALLERVVEEGPEFNNREELLRLARELV